MQGIKGWADALELAQASLTMDARRFVTRCAASGFTTARPSSKKATCAVHTVLNHLDEHFVHTPQSEPLRQALQRRPGHGEGSRRVVARPGYPQIGRGACLCSASAPACATSLPGCKKTTESCMSASATFLTTCLRPRRGPTPSTRPSSCYSAGSCKCVSIRRLANVLSPTSPWSCRTPTALCAMSSCGAMPTGRTASVSLPSTSARRRRCWAPPRSAGT